VIFLPDSPFHFAVSVFLPGKEPDDPLPGEPFQKSVLPVFLSGNVSDKELPGQRSGI
jgi:hypothetical protein